MKDERCDILHKERQLLLYPRCQGAKRFKLNGCAFLEFVHTIDEQFFASFNSKLLAFHFYNSVHLYFVLGFWLWAVGSWLPRANGKLLKAKSC